MSRLKQKIHNLSDNELLQHYKSTLDSVYLGELYSRYMPLVYGSCLKYLKNSDNAKDAVMQIFEDLLDKTQKHNIQNFKSWLYIVVKNYCLMQLRANSKIRTLSFDEKIMDFTDDFHLNNVNENEYRANALNDCINALPTEQQLSIKKFYIESLSYMDITEITGYDLKKVKSYIQNGKRNLKLCLEKKGIKSLIEETE